MLRSIVAIENSQLPSFPATVEIMVNTGMIQTRRRLDEDKVSSWEPSSSGVELQQRVVRGEGACSAASLAIKVPLNAEAFLSR